MSEARAEIAERRRISIIWLVPLVALVLGIGMVLYTFVSQGPLITIVFADAEGIEAGNTKIKVLNVEVGLVESAKLGDDLSKVVVKARIDKAAAPLLREGTQFWVVRPRIGTQGVSGLGTLLSGGYIQLAPGTGEPGVRSFEGLEEPPITPAGTPGLQLSLLSERAGSVSSGDPILYKGFRIGRVESAELDLESQGIRYSAFITAPYDALVTSNTRFWNASGISVSASADGVAVDTAALETLLIGGVAMGLPEGIEPGTPVAPGESFELYASFASVNERPYKRSLQYVVRFPQSVRGLRPGAPVEYRGVRLGRVERLLLREQALEGLTGQGMPIPVLIRVEPGRLELPDTKKGMEELAQAVEIGVGHGLRATLATGSLITGSLYVSLDFYPDERPAEMGSFAGHATIPSITTGLAGMEQKVSLLLDRLNALPLDATLDRAGQALASLNRVLDAPDTRALPASLEATLGELRETLDSVSAESALQTRLLQTIDELDRTLASLRGLLGTLEQQPNALFFNREAVEDPQPPAGSP